MKGIKTQSWLLLILLFVSMITGAESLFAATDVTDMVQINKSRMLFDRRTSENYFDASLTNISEDVILAPIKVVIDSISADSVTVANADGYTDDGKPYFEYTTISGQFPANETTSDKSWRFANPQRERFNFSVSALVPEANLANPSDPQVVELGSGPDAIAIDTLVYDGQVELPRGSSLSFESLRVDSGLFSGSPLSEHGRFTARMNVESTGLLRVVDNAGNGYLMKVFPKAEELAEVNPIIDAKSTAIALLALQPGVITADPYIDAVILAILARLPEVDNLADLITQGLQNGTFHFNRELSPDVLNALRTASNALATISAQDLQAANFSDTLEAIVTSWLDTLIPPAFAEINFDDPCTDLFSNQFKPASGNRDDVCIGAEIDSVLRQGTFYMSNPRTRWVFLTTNTNYMSSEVFSVVDVIPARHFSYPNLLELLWDSTLTTRDVFIDIWNLDFQHAATDKFEERMDKHFGPASSEAHYNFLGDGEQVFNTVAFARNLENTDAFYTLYGASLVTTIFTEFAIPWVEVASDYGDFSKSLDAEYGDCLLSCAENNKAFLDMVTDAARLVAGEATTSEFLEWIANDILFNDEFYEYIACAAGPEASELVSGLKDKLSSVVGGPAAYVNVASALLTAGSNTILLTDTFLDNSLASLDSYVAVVGSGCIDDEICGDGIDNDCDGQIDEGCGDVRVEITPSRDIWTTSVYSYDPPTHFSGCGGGRNDEYLRVGGWGDNYYSLIKFDLSNVTTEVASAKLRLYNTIDTSNTSQTVPMNLDRITSDWDWTTNQLGPCTLDNERLWWADRPQGVLFSGPLDAPEPSSYWEVDITNLVNGWISGDYPNYGLQLRPTSNVNEFNIFASSENANPEWWPKLLVQFYDDAVILDDFESYPLGDIAGQSNGNMSWAFEGGNPAGTAQVVSNIVHGGTKSLRTVDNSIFKGNFTPTTNDKARLSYWEYVDKTNYRALVNSPITWDTMQVFNASGNSDTVYVNLCEYSTGGVGLYVSDIVRGNSQCTDNLLIGNAGFDEWIFIEVEFDFIADTVRGRLNGGMWGSWQLLTRIIDPIQIASLRLLNGSSGEVYYDDFRLTEKPAAMIPSLDFHPVPQ